jgi:putative ABC transport system ATP-binding protein
MKKPTGPAPERPKAPLIVTKGLHKHFQLGDQMIHALNGVDLTIPHGQFVVIMGASGSGKSTLLYAMTGLDTPSAGEIYVEGNRLDQIGDEALAHLRGRMIGFVFQGFYLVPTMTAIENVMLAGMFARHPRELRFKRASQLLQTLQLGDRMYNRPNQLSGGQQQRVAIARALYNNPPVIVGDEPTGALDSKTGTIIMRLLRKLVTQQGKTVIIVTHDENATQYADRVIRLRDGHIISDEQKARQ